MSRCSLKWLNSYCFGSCTPKAYRWVAEMEEISGFAGEHAASRELYAAVAHFYDQIARDFESDQKDVTALKDFLSGAGPS